MLLQFSTHSSLTVHDTPKIQEKMDHQLKKVVALLNMLNVIRLKYVLMHTPVKCAMSIFMTRFWTTNNVLVIACTSRVTISHDVFKK